MNNPIEQKIEELKKLHAFQEDKGWYTFSERMFNLILKEAITFGQEPKAQEVREKIEPLNLDEFLPFPEGSIHSVPRLARKINEIIRSLTPNNNTN